MDRDNILNMIDYIKEAYGESHVVAINVGVSNTSLPKPEGYPDDKIFGMPPELAYTLELSLRPFQPDDAITEKLLEFFTSVTYSTKGAY